ncbi:MAG: hypothetical protein GYA24_21760 [Candidatus Lokiarchaeota archaeon]|nr:hypothetical protein [Candidatus Lokiarchaeota archaeon]
MADEVVVDEDDDGDADGRPRKFNGLLSIHDGRASSIVKTGAGDAGEGGRACSSPMASWLGMITLGTGRPGARAALDVEGDEAATLPLFDARAPMDERFLGRACGGTPASMVLGSGIGLGARAGGWESRTIAEAGEETVFIGGTGDGCTNGFADDEAGCDPLDANGMKVGLAEARGLLSRDDAVNGLG